MNAGYYDFVIVGGGLAGSLLLQALQVRHPNLKYLLVEKSDRLGGNRAWAFHDADLSESSKTWFPPLITKSWDGYDVSFPDYTRAFFSRYHCVSAAELDSKLRARYAKSIRFNESIVGIKQGDDCEITFQSGEVIHAATVVVAQGWETPHQTGAWQKYVSLDLELEEPHGLERVLLMDARVPQIDGFRFFYLLPWSENRLHIEDTYYSHHTILKVERIHQEILNYIERRQWKVKSIQRNVSGTLPLILNLPAKRSKNDLPAIGAASGFFHPVTGYTLPILLRQIDAITERSNLTIPSIKKALSKVETDAKVRLRYYWLMNRLLFKAAEPTERYRILAHFYRMPEGLIQRFYSGETNIFDQLRLALGKPPVPYRKAFQVFREDF